ncbi:MAG: porin [Cyclobacteriaceae bacterium]|nr:porin [Cyclobacteriaceae bacterium]
MVKYHWIRVRVRIILFCLVTGFTTYAQEDSLQQADPVFTLSGYLDIFYTYDFNQPITDYRQTFFYNYNRHNEVNLNLGYIKLEANHTNYRAALAFQSGTYPHDNYAQEPAPYGHIFEAHAGIALSKKNNVWLDVGIMPSHIGFESAVAYDNQTLTRSLVAENSPYYLTGVKVTHQPSEALSISLLMCNGWQRIQRLPGNSLPGFGTQVQYERKQLVFSWNTFFGTDDPDSVRRLRFYNNVYATWTLSAKAALTAGFDVGFQQETKGSSTYQVWYSPVIIFNYRMTDKWSVALRGEYYADASQVIIVTDTKNGFKTAGLSTNFDYQPFRYLRCRIEARWLKSADSLFTNGTTATDSNLFVTSSVVVTIK